ncbi:hypothetical protein HMPREF0742_01265 [Rothia aeria F0184]|uniref:Uncharacterized protein n=1 Tax=Rothia aeria F0184 TaxID=888019 RepID=U7V3F3_9MICC|nr:hypothetical protein HMPREF0742_01265 [Rothia aeria F0184]
MSIPAGAPARTYELRGPRTGCDIFNLLLLRLPQKSYLCI